MGSKCPYTGESPVNDGARLAADALQSIGLEACEYNESEIAAGITNMVWDKIIYGIGIYGPDYQPVKLNKLNKGRAKYDLRKFYFTNRVVNA